MSSRIAAPHKVATALGVRDLNGVLAAIAVVPAGESLHRLAMAGIDAVRACPDLSALCE